MYRLSELVIVKWYDDEKTKELRESFEKEILGWFAVTYKKMFGCPCYLAKGKMFAGLVTNGIVITKLNSLEREDLNKKYETQPFMAGERTIKNWFQVNLDPKAIKGIIPYVKKSYDRAIASVT